MATNGGIVLARIVTCGFNEDVDLSGAAAQLAALKDQRGGITLVDADTIQLPNQDGMSIVAMRGCDETAGGLGGYLHFPGKGGDRKYRFGQDALIGDRLVWEILFAPGEFPVNAKQKIKCFGNKSGAGAEEHTVLIDFIHPGLADIPIQLGGIPTKSHVHRLGLKTGTLVAQTPSGLNSVLGDETAYEDSEIEFSSSKNNKYILRRIGNYPGLAGVGVCGVRSPDGLSDRLFPTVFASAIKGYEWDLNWAFMGDEVPRLVGAGVVTTSTEWTIELAQIIEG